MLGTAVACFALAAILGMMLAGYVLTDKPTPKALAFVHGPVAAIGIILLIFYAFYNSPSPIESIVLFIMAALGGFILIFRDLTGKSLPKLLVLAHGGIAIAGFVFLIIFVAKHAMQIS